MEHKVIQSQTCAMCLLASVERGAERQRWVVLHPAERGVGAWQDTDGQGLGSPSGKRCNGAAATDVTQAAPAAE